MGCDTGKYINTGVLLMNLPRMKEKLDLQRSFLWFRRNRHCMQLPDQDLINSCLSGNIKILENRFNNRNTYRNAGFCGDARAEGVADCILHQAKPWAELRGSAQDYLYWVYFLKTPWGRLPPEELMCLLIDIVQKSPVTHRRTTQCYKAIFHRMRKDVFRNDIAVTIWFGVKELYYRIKRALHR